MAYFTRATSSVPGATGYHFYGDSAWEHLFIHRGSAARANMPCLVYVKPGHSFNPGERVMDADTSSTRPTGIFSIYANTVLGWPVVGLEFPTVFSASSAKRESFQCRPFPGSIVAIMRAMRYLRENAKNEALWGTGGSINPNQIAMLGSSSGATNAMLATLIPPGAIESAYPNALGAPPDNAEDHRPNACIGWIGQVDWTQFALAPNGNLGPFRFDIMQYFHGQNSSITNTALANAVKRSASPWFWLPFADSKRPFWQSWGQRPTSGSGANLTPDDFLPNSIRSDVSGGKAFQDPHHYFQARPLERALNARGVPNRIIWGNSSDNGGGWNNDIVTAVGRVDPLWTTMLQIPDPDLDPLDTNHAAQAAEAVNLLRWITVDLGWPAVQP